MISNIMLFIINKLRLGGMKMGFSLNVSGGPGSFKLDDTIVTSVQLISDTPNDSNARSNDLAIGLQVKGRIIAEEISGDPTLQLAKWSMIPVEEATCYGQVTVEYIHAGTTVRSVEMSNAFVVSYEESFDNETGVGIFDLLLRQKKDRNKEYKCNGNF